MAPLIDPSACEWGKSVFLIFSDNVFASYIYYSHIFPAVAALVLGFFVWYNAPRSLPNIVLFGVTIFFATWTFLDLILWATEITQFTMFFWSIQIYFDLLIYAGMVYFAYLFIDKKDITFRKKIILALPFVPLFLLAHTPYNLIGFDYSNCDREALEGPLWQYVYLVEIGYVLWIAGLGTTRYRSHPDKAERKQIALFTTGTILFLLAFSWGNIIGNLSISWDLSQYGLFGMPVFLAFFAYLITRYQSLGVKVLSAQVLVTTSTLLVLAMLLVNKIENVRVVAVLTATLIAILGYMLIQSVKREIEQRERIELLAKDLERSNKQQVTLIHFITHQLKGFVGKARNIFSMIQEGDYGVMPETMKPVVEEGFKSSTKGAETIQQILNASNMQTGKVEYMKQPFDFTAMAQSIVSKLKSTAAEKGVALTFEAPADTITLIGDQMQMENVIRNLVDNTVKYTPQGSIKVTLTKDEKLIRFMTEDTGVGITPEDMSHLFTEGGHGAESQKVNVDSTGFGLYIVKKIIEAHNGKVWAESEGAGKGSKFIVEIPVG